MNICWDSLPLQVFFLKDTHDDFVMPGFPKNATLNESKDCNGITHLRFGKKMNAGKVFFRNLQFSEKYD